MRQSKSVGALLGRQGFHKASSSSQPEVAAGEKSYPTNKDAYELIDECGRGVSASVYQARCLVNNDIVAIKMLDLEALTSPLDDIMREAQTMKAYKCDAILPLHCSFVVDEELWMVMPFMEGGSVAHIMRYRYPEGLDEVVIATIMKEVLTALAYVHSHGGIHRDVKAGNVLVSGHGQVKLGDFGVAATLERGGDWGGDAPGKRMTFVGTPCWMAPEVLEQTAGYGSPADIWSAGITLLEMAHGHAPFSKLPPMKVLLMTLQGPPPQLEAQYGARHFSRGMREVVARCLNKDPEKRPSARQLLEHKFFKQARDAEYLKRHILADMPPLPVRVCEIRVGKAATRGRDNDCAAVASHISYMTDVAQWDFNCTKATCEDEAAAGDSLPRRSRLVGRSSQDDIATDQQQQQQQSPGGGMGTGAKETGYSGSSSGEQQPQPTAFAGPAAAAAAAEDHAAAAAAAAGSGPQLSCFSGGTQVAVFPLSTPNTPDQSPGHSRPTTPDHTTAAATAKKHGRFVYVEGLYEGPELSVSSSAVEEDVVEDRSSKSLPLVLVRQRSVSSPNVSGMGNGLDAVSTLAAAAAAAAAGVPGLQQQQQLMKTSSSDASKAAAAISPVRSPSRQRQQQQGASAAAGGAADRAFSGSSSSSTLARPGACLTDVYGTQTHCRGGSSSSSSASEAVQDLTKVRTKSKSEYLTAAQVWDHVREACTEPVAQITHFWKSVAHSPKRRHQHQEGSSSSSNGPDAVALAAQGSNGPWQLFTSSFDSSHGEGASGAVVNSLKGTGAGDGSSSSLQGGGSSSSSRPPRYQAGLVGSGSLQQRLSDSSAALTAAAAAAAVQESQLACELGQGEAHAVGTSAAAAAVGGECDGAAQQDHSAGLLPLLAADREGLHQQQLPQVSPPFAVDVTDEGSFPAAPERSNISELSLDHFACCRASSSSSAGSKPSLDNVPSLGAQASTEEAEGYAAGHDVFFSAIQHPRYDQQQQQQAAAAAGPVKVDSLQQQMMQRKVDWPVDRAASPTPAASYTEQEAAAATAAAGGPSSPARISLRISLGDSPSAAAGQGCSTPERQRRGRFIITST